MTLPLALALLAAPHRAFAADVPSAQAAFDAGQRLAEAGDYAGAAALFEQSERLEPALGTTLNLANCYEHLRRFASALAAFRRGASAAAVGSESRRARRATERADALAARVSTLTVVVENGDSSGEDVWVDNAPLPRADWGAPRPVDGGRHSVVLRGQKHRDRTIELRVADEGEHASVSLPLLEPVSAPEALAGPKEPSTVPLGRQGALGTDAKVPASFWTPLRIGGGVTVGVGVVAIGVGAAFGLQASSLWHARQPECPNNFCSDRGYALTADARDAAFRSTAVFIGAGALLLGGTVALAIGPRTRHAAAVGVAVSPRAITLQGVF